MDSPDPTRGALNAQLRHLSLSSSGANNAHFGDEDLSLASFAHDGPDGVGGMLGGSGGGEDDSFDLMGSAPPVFGDGFGEGEDETVRFAPMPPPVPVVAAQEKGKGRGDAEAVFFGGSMAVQQAKTAAGGFDPFAGSSVPSSSSAARARGVDGDALDDDEEDDEEGWTEEEKKRVRQLREERDYVRGMNRVLSGLKGELGKMEGKFASVGDTIETSHQLLDLYSRIASQAEHTKDLLLDGEWEGVQKDYDRLLAAEAAAAEAEQRRQQEELEAQERREREAREAEERAARAEEARRAAAGAGTRGTARGRGVVRGSLSSRGRLTSTASSSTRGRPAGSSSIPSPSTRPSANSSSSSFSSSGIPAPTAGSASGIGRGSAPVSGVRGVRGLRSRVATAGARGGRGRGAGTGL
ncbi:hypothetical protein JCM8097_002645 [Rhodosporidiobolus ruineniae]